MPPELYSLPLRRCAVEEVRKASFGEGVRAVDRTTGGHVPKRQMQQLTERSAQDFEAFYEQKRAQEPEDPNSLLLLSSDAGGVTMRKEALREATRKEAEADAERARATGVKSDPMSKKKPRSHDKRMATVTLVADQPRHERTVEQVIDNLRRIPEERRVDDEKPKTVKPTHKTLVPTLEKSATAAIFDMFDEADRRDPGKTRETVALVDGQIQQRDAILRQAAQRARALTLIIDLIHVIQYLWIAAKALRTTSQDQWLWVVFYLEKLLRCSENSDVSYVAAGITRSATNLQLTGAARKQVQTCVNYLLSHKAHLHYATYLSRGYPIATGAIEGAIRYLIRDRMDITGARWGLACGEAVLRLRALFANDDFDEYWRFHLEQERLRNYPTFTANDNVFVKNAA